MTNEDVSQLAALMHVHGLTKLKLGDLELERPAFAVAAAMPEPKPAPDDEERDPLDVLRTMSPDAVDKALMLTPTRGPQ